MLRSLWSLRARVARRRLFPVFIAAGLIALFAAPSIPQRIAAQDTGTGSVSLTTAEAPVSESFDTLATTGTANTTLPPGWYITESGGGARDNEQYAADTGASGTGDIYSYGATAVTERALGALRSGTLIPLFGARFTNNVGSAIRSLTISYTGEQWRLGAAGRTDRIDFQYSTDATDLSTGTWIDVDALDFTTPNTVTTGLKDGNNAANRAFPSATIAVNIPNGATFAIRWTDLDPSGADDGLAVDNFTLTPSIIAPPPQISVNDVSLTEGDSGTRLFHFIVSLSEAAGPGGVQFMVGSADGTATDADNDYEPVPMAMQSIPEGQQTYEFDVTVNGDAFIEPNETFFVNVINPVNATIFDGQGVGTIQNDDVNITFIHDVQGSGDASPLVSQNVSVRGIVTLLRSNGFFIQEEVSDNDADPNTSEGIFVFTVAAPLVAVGDVAIASGSVVEFNGLTEISSSNANVAVQSTGNELPTAVTLTPDDLPPTALYTQPQLEKYEGMRLHAAQLFTVAPNDGFFDVYTVLSGVARPMREAGIPVDRTVPPDPTSELVELTIPRFDLNPERLSLDTNGRAGSVGVAITARIFLNDVTGPLDYSFGEYHLIPQADPTVVNLSAIPVAAPNSSEFTVASMNLRQFNNNATQRTKASMAVRNVMRNPDVIGMQEIFDLADLQALADQINNDTSVAGQPNPGYTAYLVDYNDATTGDIDLGFLVRSRVTVESVIQHLASETYIDPVTMAPDDLHDRPPLVLRGSVNQGGGRPPVPMTVVNNHTRSLIGIDEDPGDGPRVRRKRMKQAESIALFLDQLDDAEPTRPIIAVGDYNATQVNDGYVDTIRTLKGQATVDAEQVEDASPDLIDTDFVLLTEDLVSTDRYTFVFEGTPEALDHIFVNDAARDMFSRYQVARNNADFPESPAAAYLNNPARPERASDHDNPVAYFVTLSTTTSLFSSFNPSFYGQNVTFTAIIAPSAGGTLCSGSVTFFDNGVPLGTSPLDGNNQATLQTAALGPGTHPITAQYLGAASCLGSTSDILSQVVTGAPTITELESDSNPSNTGQEVTFTATVQIAIVGTPTGDVEFRDGSLILGTAPLVNGVAEFSTSALSAGNHSITAFYEGDSEYEPSTSDVLIQIVEGVGMVRAWVASNGVDSNPCTRAAPCRNFGAAVAAVVSGGEVVVLDSAGYGPAVLNKSVTVLAPAGIHGAIAPTAGNALTINAGSTDVVILRGLYLNSQGADTGIEFMAGGALFVESNVVSGFGVSGILFGSEGELFLSDSIVRENGLTGINVQSLSGLAVVQIQRTRVEANGEGVVLAQNARASIRQTVAARNTGAGFRVSQPSGHVTLEKSASIGNATGLWVADGAGTITGGLIGHNTNGMIAEGMGVLYVSNTTITGNGMGLNSLIGGTLTSFGNNRLAGNDTDGTFTSTTDEN